MLRNAQGNTVSEEENCEGGGDPRRRDELQIRKDTRQRRPMPYSLELFNAMAEYGDYLAYTCSALKTEGMNDLIWKMEKLDWQAVAEKIKKEETTLAEERDRGLLVSSTPYLDDVAKAADRLGYEVDLVRYQILAYAERNNFCHSGIKAMIHHGHFQILAERIMQDKMSLEVIFRGRPSAQIEMRKVIKIVEK